MNCLADGRISCPVNHGGRSLIGAVESCSYNDVFLAPLGDPASGSPSLNNSQTPVETERQQFASAKKATVHCTRQRVVTSVRQVGLLSTAGVDS